MTEEDFTQIADRLASGYGMGSSSELLTDIHALIAEVRRGWATIAQRDEQIVQDAATIAQRDEQLAQGRAALLQQDEQVNLIAQYKSAVAKRDEVLTKVELMVLDLLSLVRIVIRIT